MVLVEEWLCDKPGDDGGVIAAGAMFEKRIGWMIG